MERAMQKAITITALNKYVKALLENDVTLRDLYVEGEISNMYYARNSGHMYFTLKDSGAAVQCVMFRSYASTLKFVPADGEKVIARCKVSLYEKGGTYQLSIYAMYKAGEGALNLALEQLKLKLEKEGLFAIERKRRLPKFPKKIGVITSPDGAAVQDIINIITRRYPFTSLIIFPTSVQGVLAEGEMVRAINNAIAYPGLDLAIITRGGGSAENLDVFNSEKVARAAAMLPVPFISAVGHETDTTIIDHIADLRAPTPSAAAEQAVPSSADLMAGVDVMMTRMSRLMDERMNSYTQRIDMITARIGTYVDGRISSYEQRIDMIGDRMGTYVDGRLSLYKSQISNLNESIINKIQNNVELKERNLIKEVAILESLNPLAVLTRGYSIVEKGDLRVSSSKDLSSDDEINIKFADGDVKGKVIG